MTRSSKDKCLDLNNWHFSQAMDSVVDDDPRAFTTMPSSESSQLDTLGSQGSQSSQHGVVLQKNSFEAEAAAGSMLNTPWYTRILDKAKRSFPMAHRRVSQALLYGRGPYPPVPLPRKSIIWPTRGQFVLTWTPAPKPFLNLSVPAPLHMTMGWPEYVSVPVETWFIRKTMPFARTWLMLFFGAGYIVALSFLARAQWFTIPADSFVTCTSTYWQQNDGCGLDGESCAPFSNVTFDFRCPSQCTPVILLNPRAVGAEMVDFVPLVVGGGSSGNASFTGSYRGDSFICAAAVHA